MKKTLLAATAMAVLTTATSFANCAHSNWSAGIHAGWMSTKGDIKANNTKINDSRYSTAPVGIHLDWTRSTANSWLYGFGLATGYAFGKPTHNFTLTGVNYKAQLDPRWYGEINTRLGWNFNNAWSLYGIMSGRVINTKFSVKTTTAPTTTLAAHSKSVWGFGLGAGADFKVAERWTLGVKYRHFWDQSVSKKVGATNYKAKLGSHSVVGALSYNF